jgi:predicted dehydrogenase
LNAPEARQIADRARARNLVVLEAMWTRFLPHMKRIHEIIDAGTLGELRSLSAEHRQFLPTDPKHRLTRSNWVAALCWTLASTRSRLRLTSSVPRVR